MIIHNIGKYASSDFKSRIKCDEVAEHQNNGGHLGPERDPSLSTTC